jgi:hypothetical protein
MQAGGLWHPVSQFSLGLVPCLGHPHAGKAQVARLSYPAPGGGLQGPLKWHGHGLEHCSTPCGETRSSHRDPGTGVHGISNGETEECLNDIP